jgi:hypothetical protein
VGGDHCILGLHPSWSNSRSCLGTLQVSLRMPLVVGRHGEEGAIWKRKVSLLDWRSRV